MKTFRRLIIFIIPLLLIGFSVSTLYKWNYIQHRQFIPNELSIPEIQTGADFNRNRIDDATDILDGALDYISTKPQYEELKKYPDGWPTENRGQAGDVIAMALKNAGYDLQKLITEDLTKNPAAYKNQITDNDLAFRSVGNLFVFFSSYATPKTLDYEDVKKWQAGDIVFFEKGHAAVVADKVNQKGVRFIIHHFWPYQAGYYQDILESGAWGKITGHFSVNEGMASLHTD